MTYATPRFVRQANPTPNPAPTNTATGLAPANTATGSATTSALAIPGGPNDAGN